MLDYQDKGIEANPTPFANPMLDITFVITEADITFVITEIDITFVITEVDITFVEVINT